MNTPSPPFNTSSNLPLANPLASSSQSNTRVFSGTVDSVDAIKRVGNWFTNSTRQPTGFYLPAGASLLLTLAVISDPSGGEKPEIHIGAPDTNPNTSNWASRIYPLTPGQNTVIDPDGGMIYFSMIGPEFSVQITFLSAMEEVPFFELGKTSASAFQMQLKTFTQAPQVELVSPRVMLTVERNSALPFQNVDPDELMSLYEEIVDVVEQLIGLDDCTPVHTRAALRYHLCHGNYRQIGWAHAGHSYTAYSDAAVPELLDPRQLMLSWGIAHELGHQNQMLAYLMPELLETTNNLVSLNVERHFGQKNTLLTTDANGLNVWDQALAKHQAPLPTLSMFNVYEQLVPLEQLRLGFGEGFWPLVNKITRERWASDATLPPKDIASDNLVQFCSIAASADLRQFFASWGFSVTAKGDQSITALQLPSPRADLATLRDPASLAGTGPMISGSTPLILSPPNGGSVPTGGFTASGKAPANTRVGLYKADGSYLTIVNSDINGDWSATISQTVSDIKAALFDANGLPVSNWSQIHNLSVAGSASTKTLALAPGTPPIVDGAIVRSIRPVIRGKAAANAIVQVYQAGVGSALGVTNADANGDWRLLLTTDLMLTPHSTSNIALAQYDTLGQRITNWSTMTLIIGSMPPLSSGTPALINPPDASILPNSTFTVYGIGQANSRVGVFLADNTFLAVVNCDTNGFWSAALTLGVGAWSIKAVLADVQGKQISAWSTPLYVQLV